MLKETRFEHILSKLKSNNQVFFEELALELAVSEDTIRRDIDILAKSGLMVKVRGGAISPAQSPLTFQQRKGLFTEGKQRIALKAQQHLSDVKTVFLDGGTTILAVASALPLNTRLRIITNNLALPQVLVNHKDVEIIIMGGNYIPGTQTTVGVQTCTEAAKYVADLYLMGTCALDSNTGITAQFAEDGEVKKALLKSARKTVALITQEKLNKTDYFKVARLDEIDGIITDLPSDSEQLASYRFSDLQIF
ncbi:DeoR/GlpR family DNA-binding transcription regulator [Dyadobacter sandarakinus]|uniref:DeoR/GlpR transcriptional regulator n=1 Tax=Dyadobacter sandarakinus TaxID=2747268 RepID=A0ABX7I261_9BACT|nr:DeoR/GlpR family DNA-binding transcription regulator [Dyadobacter sandarakinus]QRR00167.1 DeoR/GlpR transcriptional regulator [Dyadobacter sandarakinus]